jgi:hypothetical protein
MPMYRAETAIRKTLTRQQYVKKHSDVNAKNTKLEYQKA